MNLALLYLTIGAITTFVAPQRSHLASNIHTEDCKQWVDSVYNSLSPRERVAQLMIPHLNPADGESSKAAIKRMVENNSVGGILFYRGTVDDYAQMTNYAQSIAKVPLLMTLDGEWGAAMRMPDAPEFPRNIALGAISDEKLLYEYGKEMARQCKALGIQVNFAPVLDVNSNPDNPVIGNRSYGENPPKVSKLGKAYSLGLEAGGVMAVGKHFPGHGDTSTDSHKEFTTVNKDRQSLISTDLLPYKDYIKANCHGIMVGHISVPALDSTEMPASMSRAITTDLLKKDMGFDGLVFTDGLGMNGANIGKNRCVGALMAGADALLCPMDVPKDIDAVLTAIENGQLDEQAVEASVKKVLAYKYALGLNQIPKVDEENIHTILNTPGVEDLIQRLTNASITVLRNDNRALPINDLSHNTIALVNIGESSHNLFDQLCRKYADVKIYNGINLTSENIKELEKYKTVIGAVYSHNSSDITQLDRLTKCNNLISVFFINPYKMKNFRHAISDSKAIVAAYDNTPYALRAAAQALFGGIEVNGCFPVNVDGVAHAGQGLYLPKTRLGYTSLTTAKMSADLEAKIDSAINYFIDEGAFPGCQILVARRGNVVIDKSYGRITKNGPKVDDETLYDLASVSKTVGTLPGVMKAYDLGLFQLDEPASIHVPGLRVEGKDDITPRMLLFHETGIIPSLNLYNIMIDSACYKGTTLLSGKKDKKHPVKIYRDLYGVKNPKLRKDILSQQKTDEFEMEVAKGIYMSTATRDTVMQRIYDSKLKPTRDYVYSCLNFCLLMDMEQRITGQKHDQWMADSIWGPLGAYGFRYNPAHTYPLDKIAYTEDDTYLRNQHIHGYVHDELAAFSGGVQGNAGVFGTATDIAKLCQMWLNNGWYGDAEIISPETSLLFTNTKSPNSRRGLGFDKPDTENPDNSPTCDEAGAKVYGHTGFTGTVYWVDPEEDLIFVFLCNRVDPTRNNKSFAELNIRPGLFSLVYQSLLH